MRYRITLLILSLSFLTFSWAEGPLKPMELLGLKNVTSAVINPQGTHIAYTVSVPRSMDDDAGSNYAELHVYNWETKKSTPFITGKVNLTNVTWTPDGKFISFLMKRAEKEKKQVWKIALSGGEATQVTNCGLKMSAFKWHPSGKQIAFLSYPKTTKREKALEKKGYDFIYYEEDLKHKNLYMLNIAKESKAVQLTKDITVWSFNFSADGQKIAYSAAEKNLVDYKYMFTKVYVLDLKSGKAKQVSKNEGKLGNFTLNKDGSYLAYTASYDRKDHAVSQVYVANVASGKVKNLTPKDFMGHVNHVAWKDKNHIYYKANVGVNITLSQIGVNGNGRKVVLDSQKGGPIFKYSSMSKNGKRFAFIGNAPTYTNELFTWSGAGSLKRATNLNPVLNTAKLGKQVPYTYKARDGYKVEGLLIYPVDYKKGKKYPLIIQVHGGPESVYSNGWISRYANPGQVMAGEGYVVFYPNYRASTGYGLKHAAFGFNAAAEIEFDDIADAIDHFVEIGMADKERVGLGGGSYGGFASAWFATYYTEKVKAVAMFVGISNLISKRSTTDIPWEELYVHSGKKLEDMWEKSLKQSPIYYAHQSKTATLIYGGAADPRVHPAQSLELYRRMKMNAHPAVRLVQYPGEPHGNRKQPGKADVLFRQLAWYKWFVMDGKPLDGTMPALKLTEKFGLDLPKE